MERDWYARLRTGLVILLGMPFLSMGVVWLILNIGKKPVYEAYGSVELSAGIGYSAHRTSPDKRLIGNEAALLQTDSFHKRVLEELSAADRVLLDRSRAVTPNPSGRKKIANSTNRALSVIGEVVVSHNAGQDSQIYDEDALVRGTSLLSVVDENTDPELAAALVNATIRAATTANLVIASGRGAKTRAFLESKLIPLEEKIEQEEAEERRQQPDNIIPLAIRAGAKAEPAAAAAPPQQSMRRRNKSAQRQARRRLEGASQLGEGQIAVTNPGEDPEVPILEGAAERAGLDERLAAVKLRLTQALGPIEGGELVLEDSEDLNSRLRKELGQARVAYASLAESLGVNHPQMREGLARIDALEQQVRESDRRLLAVKQEAAETAARRGALGAAASAAREKARLLLQKQENSALLEMSLAIDLNSLAFLRQEMQSVILDTTFNEPLVNVVDFAQVPILPMHQSHRFLLKLSGALGFGLGFLIVVLLQLLTLRRWTVADVESSAGRPVVSIVREFETGAAGRMASNAERGAMRRNLEEPLHGLQDAMPFIRGAQSSLIVALTSVLPGEGTTTIAGALAMRLARGGERVLLLDANMHRPGVGRSFGLEGALGVSHILTGRATLEAAAQMVFAAEAGRGRLDVLSAGPRTSDPYEALRSYAMRQLLLEARSQYDYVLVDTCLSQGLNGMLISDAVDAVFLVVRYGRIDMRTLRSGRRLMVRGHLPLTAVVINGVTE